MPSMYTPMDDKALKVAPSPRTVTPKGPPEFKDYDYDMIAQHGRYWPAKYVDRMYKLAREPVEPAEPAEEQKDSCKPERKTPNHKDMDPAKSLLAENPQKQSAQQQRNYKDASTSTTSQRKKNVSKLFEYFNKQDPKTGEWKRDPTVPNPTANLNKLILPASRVAVNQRLAGLAPHLRTKVSPTTEPDPDATEDELARIEGGEEGELDIGTEIDEAPVEDKPTRRLTKYTHDEETWLLEFVKRKWPAAHGDENCGAPDWRIVAEEYKSHFGRQRTISSLKIKWTHLTVLGRHHVSTMKELTEVMERKKRAKSGNSSNSAADYTPNDGNPSETSCSLGKPKPKEPGKSDKKANGQSEQDDASVPPKDCNGHRYKAGQKQWLHDYCESKWGEGDRKNWSVVEKAWLNQFHEHRSGANLRALYYQTRPKLAAKKNCTDHTNSNDSTKIDGAKATNDGEGLTGFTILEARGYTKPQVDWLLEKARCLKNRSESNNKHGYSIRNVDVIVEEFNRAFNADKTKDDMQDALTLAQIAASVQPKEAYHNAELPMADPNANDGRGWPWEGRPGSSGVTLPGDSDDDDGLYDSNYDTDNEDLGLFQDSDDDEASSPDNSFATLSGEPPSSNTSAHDSDVEMGGYDAKPASPSFQVRPDEDDEYDE